MATHPAAVAAPSPRSARALVIFATWAAAACGFVYELVLVALGTYLYGNSVEQVSVVLGIFVAAMGAGSLVSKPLMRSPVAALVAIEGAVALVGGLSAMALYAAFAWLDLYVPAMLATAALIGLLVGAELPLLVTLVQRIRRESAGRSASDLLAADYAGALVAGLAFPFLLLPLFGQVQSAMAVGALNATVGLVLLGVFRAEVRRPVRIGLAAGLALVLLALGGTAAVADRFQTTARQALYEDPIILAKDTKYQSIVLTEALRTDDLRLFLNGDLQFSSVDERRYHESLVHPAMAGRHERVLILGGGDGLAAREVLRYPDVRGVTLVELDPAMWRLAAEDPRLRALNGNAADDPRLTVVHQDAFSWLRRAAPAAWDVIIADLPDPDDAALAKMYSVEAYGMMRRALTPGGRIVVQSGSPFFAQDAYWDVEATLRAAGLATVPYHVDVPSFGDWGFHLAARGAAPALRLDPPAGLSFLDPAVLAAAAVFPRDRGRTRVEPSTLDKPTILGYQRRGWRDY
jgi:spermidine synthase